MLRDIKAPTWPTPPRYVATPNDATPSQVELTLSWGFAAGLISFLTILSIPILSDWKRFLLDTRMTQSKSEYNISLDFEITFCLFTRLTLSIKISEEGTIRGKGNKRFIHQMTSYLANCCSGFKCIYILLMTVVWGLTYLKNRLLPRLWSPDKCSEL